jgi:hypothetical protein
LRCRRWLALPFAGEIPDLFGFDPLSAPILAASVASS